MTTSTYEPLNRQQNRARSASRALPAEYLRLASRVVRPLVVAAGNRRSRVALESAGCDVHSYDGSEISQGRTEAPPA